MPASRANGMTKGHRLTYSKSPHRKGINLRHRKSRWLSRVKSSYRWSPYHQWGQHFIPNIPWDFEGVFSSYAQGKGRSPQTKRFEHLRLSWCSGRSTLCVLSVGLSPYMNPHFIHIWIIWDSLEKKELVSAAIFQELNLACLQGMWVRHTVSIPLSCVMPLERQMNQQQGPSQKSLDVASPKADGINGFLSLDVTYKISVGDRKL